MLERFTFLVGGVSSLVWITTWSCGIRLGTPPFF